MGKKVVILQSNYLPWKGYFDLMNQADVFVVYDIVQYTKNDWRNRNRVMSPSGPKWLTIPVYHGMSQTIEETLVSDQGWWKKHWKTLQQNYSKCRYFPLYRDRFAALFSELKDEKRLSHINLAFIRLINELLRIETKIVYAAQLDCGRGQTERLVRICQSFSADTYISGPGAKDYLNERLFEQANIAVSWYDYSDYPQYQQLSDDFVHRVSIIDLLFNHGPDARHYMKSFA